MVLISRNNENSESTNTNTQNKVSCSPLIHSSQKNQSKNKIRIFKKTVDRRLKINQSLNLVSNHCTLETDDFQSRNYTNVVSNTISPKSVFQSRENKRFFSQKVESQLQSQNQGKSIETNDNSLIDLLTKQPIEYKIDKNKLQSHLVKTKNLNGEYVSQANSRSQISELKNSTLNEIQKYNLSKNSNKLNKDKRLLRNSHNQTILDIIPVSKSPDNKKQPKQFIQREKTAKSIVVSYQRFDTQESDKNVYHLNNKAFNVFKSQENKKNIIHFPVKVFENKMHHKSPEKNMQYSISLEQQLVNKFNEVSKNMNKQNPYVNPLFKFRKEEKWSYNKSIKSQLINLNQKPQTSWESKQTKCHHINQIENLILDRFKEKMNNTLNVTNHKRKFRREYSLNNTTSRNISKAKIGNFNLEINENVEAKTPSHIHFRNIQRGMLSHNQKSLNDFKQTDVHFKYHLDPDKVKIVFPQPTEVELAIQKADSLIYQKRDYIDEDEFPQNYFKPDLIENKLSLKRSIQKLRNCMSKIKIIRTFFQYRDDKEKFIIAFRREQQLLQIIENDPDFKNNICSAMPETKYYINKLLLEIDAKFQIQIPEHVHTNICENEISLGSKENFTQKLKFGVVKGLTQIYNQVQDFQQKDLQLTYQEKQLINDPKNKQILQKNSKSLVLSQQDVKNVQMNIGGPSTRKIRTMLQKHFMTGFPHSLKQNKNPNFDFMLVEKLGILNRTLIKILPFDENNYQLTIGQAYEQQNVNMFSNKYLLLVKEMGQDRISDQVKKQMQTHNRDYYDKHNDSDEEKKIKRHMPTIDRYLDNMFLKQSLNFQFYKEMKKSNQLNKIHNCTKEAVQFFFEKSNKLHIVPNPSFVSIRNKTLSLIELHLSENQCNILKEFMKMTKNVVTQQIETLIIDNCHISDRNFAIILQGIKEQNGVLKKLIFTGNQLGRLGIQALNPLMSQIREIYINNLSTSINRNISRDLIDTLIEKGNNLQRIRLSNVNLDDDSIVSKLISIIYSRNKELRSIDLSNTSMSPKSLARFSQELLEYPYNIKCLNLSYNKLNFTPGTKACAYSKQFVETMVKFFTLVTLLNHLDISGMNFDKESLFSLSNVICNCPNMMAVHMNDNGIIRHGKGNDKLMLDILNIFGLGNLDIEHCCRIQIENHNHTQEDVHHETVHGNDAQIDVNKEESVHGNDAQFDVIEEEPVKSSDSMKTDSSFSSSTSKSRSKSEPKVGIRRQNQMKEDNKINSILQVQRRNSIQFLIKRGSVTPTVRKGQLGPNLLRIGQKESIKDIKNINNRNKQILDLITKTEREQNIEQRVTRQASTAERLLQISRINYSKHLVFQNKHKMIKDNQIELNAKYKDGIGKEKNGLFDHFVLTRKINNPELIWNQDPKKDSIPKYKFFQTDAAEFWQLSQKNECFICDGHRYTIIFFKKGVLTKYNKDLCEIKDKNMLSFLKQNYQTNYGQNNVYTPIISGSVVGGSDFNYPFSRFNFERKLRMMRVELYSALLISQSNYFMKEIEPSKIIKEIIVEYSRRDRIHALNAIDFDNKLSHWADLIHDKCKINELTDMHVCNARDEDFINFSEECPQDLFVYATYLKPGQHKFMIYCPQSQRAFVKTILVDVNMKDFHPEFPSIHFARPLKLIQNVWQKYQEDTIKIFEKAFKNDVKHQNFDLSPIIKDKQKQYKVMNIIRENFDVVQHNFIEMILKSEESFPQIDFTAASYYYNVEQNIVDDQEILMMSQIEMQFIRATRFQNVNGTRGKLSRFEFIDYVIRLATSAYPLMDPEDGVNIIIGLYLRPMFEENLKNKNRQIIRDRTQLNKLLFENRNGLHHIFESWRIKHSSFGQSQAILLVQKALKNNNQYQIEDHTIKQLFVHSLMIIIDDCNNSKKYTYFKFVEFLEFVCRITIECIDIIDTIESKVFIFLQLLYEAEGIQQNWRKMNQKVDIRLQPITHDD